MSTLFEKLDDGRDGIRLYGIAPPKLASTPERVHVTSQPSRWADFVCSRLTAWLSTTFQDEPGRAGQERPFPFLPIVDPEVYARDALADLAIPKVSCTDAWARTRARVFSSWIDGVRSMSGRHLSVFVGAPRGRSPHPGLPLPEAYALARAAPNLVLGGIAIAERHVAKEDEHHRMLAKQGPRLSLLHHPVRVRRRRPRNLCCPTTRIVVANDRSLARSPSCSRSRPVVRCARFRVRRHQPVARHRLPALARKRGSAIRPTRWSAPSTCARGYSPTFRTMLAKRACQSASTSRASPFEGQRLTRRWSCFGD